MSSTLLALKASSEAADAEQKKLLDKRRNAVVLVYQFLIDCGYSDTASTFSSEANNILSKYCIADNIDINVIIDEYESYYDLRFGRKPKIHRKLRNDEIEQTTTTTKPGRSNNTINSKKNSSSKETKDMTTRLPNIHSSNSNNTTSSSSSSTNNNGNDKNNNDSNNNNGSINFDIQGTHIQPTDTKSNKQPVEEIEQIRILKPPPQFGGDSEMKQLANVISREIYQDSPNVRFSDIVELNEAKRLLVEAVQLPIKYPTVFTGILRPWRGVLLHGPPGTGKTLLAKALATECHSTFFNISASTLVSKWRGESEKLVRALFEVARYYAPSTIFLDEIDSILSSRSGEAGSEHEASRRMKTELLIQMDGIKGKSSTTNNNNTNNNSSNSTNNTTTSSQVFVLAASNLPWDLDIAVLRRLEKRVYVSLPEIAAREMMMRKLLSDRCAIDVDFIELAKRTAGYSGADIELVCREAAMMPVRRLMNKLNELELYTTPTTSTTTTTTTTATTTTNNVASTIAHVPSHTSTPQRTQRPPLPHQVPKVKHEDVEKLLLSDKVTQADIMLALSTTKPSSDGNTDKYMQWQADYGSV